MLISLSNLTAMGKIQKNSWTKVRLVGLIKVAEHSFQVPMPNSPLLLNYSWFGARFLQE